MWTTTARRNAANTRYGFYESPRCQQCQKNERLPKRRICRACYNKNAKEGQTRRRAGRIRTVHREPNLSYNSRQAYTVVTDPLGDYGRGAVIPTTQIDSTLAFNGFNPGTILKLGRQTFTIVQQRGLLKLQPVIRAGSPNPDHL